MFAFEAWLVLNKWRALDFDTDDGPTVSPLADQRNKSSVLGIQLVTYLQRQHSKKEMLTLRTKLS